MVQRSGWLISSIIIFTVLFFWCGLSRAEQALEFAYSPYTGSLPVLDVVKDFESFSSKDRIITTYYFYWYDWETKQHFLNEDGSDALTEHPADPESFSYKSVSWHCKELEDMVQAGIDVALPVYWGPPAKVWPKGDWPESFQYSYQSVPNIVKACDEMIQDGMKPPKIGMFFDTSSLRGNRSYPQVDMTTPEGKRWFYEVIRDYFLMIPPKYWAVVDNRPLVAFYVTRWKVGTPDEIRLRYSKDIFKYVKEEFNKDFGVEPYLIPEVSWDADKESSVEWGAAISGFNKNGITGIGPGYNHSAVPGRIKRIAERKDGQFYEYNWLRALRSNPSIIILETWNEFHEGSVICESKEYGRQYIDLTAKYAAMFHKAIVPDPPSGDYTNAREISIVFGPNDKEHGLTHFDREDGKTTGTMVGEVACRRTIKNIRDLQFVYLRIDDSFLFGPEDNDIEIEVEYYDTAGSFRIDYDAARDPHRRHASAYSPTEWIKMGGSKQWKIAKFKLENPLFMSRQFTQGDFRFNYEGDDNLYLKKAIVRKIKKTGNNEMEMTIDLNKYHGDAGHPMAIIDQHEMKQYINSFCVTQKGTWIVSVTSGQIGKGKVYVKRSEDKGRTWTENRINVYDPDTDEGLIHTDDYDCEMGQLFPVPEPLGEHGEYRIYQISIVRNTVKGVRFGKLVYTYSEDDGKTWLGPRGENSFYDLDSPVYELVGHNWGWHLMAPPRMMSNGLVYLPMNASTDPLKLADIRCEVVFARSSNILTEKDPAKISFDYRPVPPHGLFVPLKGKPGQSHGMEAQIVELSDHRLFSVMRTGNGCVYFTVSSDFGETWDPVKPLRRDDDGDLVLNPNCACPLTKLSDGRYALLHCNNDGHVGNTKDVFAAGSVRNPIYVSLGVENDPGKEQPIRWGEPRLMTTLENYETIFDSKGRDLTYGLLHEEDGRFYHFYNAMWERIQVNLVSPELFQ